MRHGCAPLFSGRLVALAALAAAAPAAAVRGDEWSQFRGGAALGHAGGAAPPATFTPERVAWRTPIPGAGWSQPVIAGGRLYVTTAVVPNGRKPKGSGGAMDMSTLGRPSIPREPMQWRVLCLDPAKGTVLWDRVVVEAKPKYGTHASNTYATETPCATADGVIAFFGATGTLVSLDRDGAERWRREFGPQPIQNQFGTGASPVLVGDRLVLQLYNDDSARLLCLDAATGTDRWEATRDKGTSWATPVIWDNKGTAEVVAAGQGTIIGYALADGSERWRYGGLDTSFACSVVADREAVYFGTSSPGSSAPAAAIAAGHGGDLSLAKGAKSSSAVWWSRSKSGAGMPSPVVVGDLLYFFGSTAVCFDKRTGEEKFRKRMPGGTQAVGCPVVVGETIYVLNESGKVLAFKAGPDYELLGESAAGSDDEVWWSTPAVADGALFVRSSDAVSCIR
ncbi:MAG: PQQ-binding-like beta-propeller repeat protein [Planctomycetes bacterium]|nr:PQQ-binding-like beta-propeller repeat protein [Planctomycetota bacterium]